MSCILEIERNKFKEATKKLCCCCGLFPATEPNGLCKDCAENCAGYLLKDKPCVTTESPKHKRQMSFEGV
jgi:hypothetical protein